MLGIGVKMRSREVDKCAALRTDGVLPIGLAPLQAEPVEDAAQLIIGIELAHLVQRGQAE